MNGMTFWSTLLLSLAPISELRGAIPWAFYRGVPLCYAALLGCAGNLLVGPIAFTFLASLHTLFYRHLSWYVKLFDYFVVRTRKKVARAVERFGIWGIMLFVAIPLPFTGAWTGTLAAWIFGLDKKRSLLAVFGGVTIAALIVTSVIYLGFSDHSIFVKHF